MLLAAGSVAMLLFALSLLWTVVRLIRGAFSKLLATMTVLLLVIGGGSLWLSKPVYALEKIVPVPNHTHVYVATVQIGSTEQGYLEQDATHILADVQSQYPQATGIQIKFQEQVGAHLRILPVIVEWAPGGDWNAALGNHTTQPYETVFLYNWQ